MTAPEKLLAWRVKSMLYRGRIGKYNGVVKLLFVVNNPAFFLSHRLTLALAAKSSGYEVHIATPEIAGAEKVRRMGFRFHPIPLDRSRGNPLRELSSLVALFRLYRRLRPEIVHHVTIKPVLYGTLAARMARVPAVVNAISGLGYVFIRKGPIAAIVRRMVLEAYRISFRHGNMRVIFQNPDDAGLFQSAGLLTREQSVLIRGSGVDPQTFLPSPEPGGPITIILASRMLWDKGVGEFVAAARDLKARKVDARFVLVGGADAGNPACVPEARIHEAVAAGWVEWWGHRADMERILPLAHIVCLPSYREGLPKVLIEAAACARPIVATDVPGCREIVRSESNGLLVRPRDPRSLAEALARLIADAGLRQRMGAMGRSMVLSHFSAEIIEGETLDVYRQVASRTRKPADTLSGPMPGRWAVRSHPGSIEGSG